MNKKQLFFLSVLCINLSISSQCYASESSAFNWQAPLAFAATAVTLLVLNDHFAQHRAQRAQQDASLPFWLHNVSIVSCSKTPQQLPKLSTFSSMPYQSRFFSVSEKKDSGSAAASSVKMNDVATQTE